MIIKKIKYVTNRVEISEKKLKKARVKDFSRLQNVLVQFLTKKINK